MGCKAEGQRLCGSDGAMEIRLSGKPSGWEGGRVPVYHRGCQAGARLAMAHSPPCPRPLPPMLSWDGGDGWGGGLGMEGQAGVQPRPPAGCDGGQAGPVGGSFPAPQDRQTERARAGLVMVLRAAGWAGRGQDVAWPPLGPHVPRGGHCGCPPPGSSAGDNVGCPERVGRHPYSQGDSPQPALGVVNMAEHSSSKCPPKQPWEWEFARSGGPRGRRC